MIDFAPLRQLRKMAPEIQKRGYGLRALYLVAGRRRPDWMQRKSVPLRHGDSQSPASSSIKFRRLPLFDTGICYLYKCKKNYANRQKRDRPIWGQPLSGDMRVGKPYSAAGASAFYARNYFPNEYPIRKPMVLNVFSVI